MNENKIYNNAINKFDDYVWLCNKFGFDKRGKALEYWIDKLSLNKQNKSIKSVINILLDISDSNQNEWNQLSQLFLY